jgi:hypothetical protein
MQNTSVSHKLTHNSEKQNYFKKTKRQIAGSGLLERITFVQWRISEEIQKYTDNVNVIRLAALLAALPRMGVLGIDFSHAQLAKKFGELYHVPAPSRKSICLWEKELSTLELPCLLIPRHKASKPKTRVFTQEFWDLARQRMPKLSYNSVPVTWFPPNEDLHTTAKQILTKNTETEIRADVIEYEEPEQTRAPSQNIKFSRPPKHKHDDGTPKGLDKFENSVCWWLFKNKNRGSYRQACLIFAEFLRMYGCDPYYAQLKKAWAECRDSERPGLVSDLIRNLTPSLPETGVNTPIMPPPLVVSSMSIPDEPQTTTDPEIAKLRIAMVFGESYNGRYSHVLAEFRRASDARQMLILKKLEEGHL